MVQQAALRQQQQRLLLLRHASKCPVKDGKCKVTPHCAAMKRLWRHISDCKNQQCPVDKCVSSRFVLSHYHRCKDPMCSVCLPVRDVITKSYQRQLAEIRSFAEDQPIQQQAPLLGLQVRFQRKANGVRSVSDAQMVPCFPRLELSAPHFFFQPRYSEADEILRKAIQKYQAIPGWNQADACRLLLDRARSLEPQVRAFNYAIYCVSRC